MKSSSSGSIRRHWNSKHQSKMRLKELEIANMGPHEHIHVTDITELFGILGKNGKGKSIVLACMKAAMTSFWPGNDPGASYVRNCYLEAPDIPGADDPLPEDPEERKAEEKRRKKASSEFRKKREKVFPSNGHVRVVFEINGVVVESYRREGKSPKVWLSSSELDDKLTSVSAISEYLSKLYGADLKAISEAAFLQQGTLDKVFSSTPAERLTQFMTILNLHYLEKRVQHLDGKIQRLQKDVVDLSGAQDAINEERKIAQESIATLRERLAQLPSKKEALAASGDVLSSMARLEDKAESKVRPGVFYTLLEAPEKLKEESGELQVRWDGAVKAVTDAFGHADMAEALKALARSKEDAYTEFQRLQREKDKWENFQSRLENLAAKKESAAVLGKDIANRKNRIAALRSEIQELSGMATQDISLPELRSKLDESHTLTTRCGELGKFIQENRTAYELAREQPAQKELDRNQARISEINSELAVQKSELGRLQRFESTIRPAVEHSKCPSDEDGKCIQCGLRLSEDNAATQKDLDDLVASQKAIEEKSGVLSQELSKLQGTTPNLQQLVKEQSDLARRYTEALEEHARMEEHTNPKVLENWEDLQTRAAQLEGQEPSLQADETTYSRQLQEIEAEDKSLQEVKPEEVKAEVVTKASERYEAAKSVEASWVAWESGSYRPAKEQLAQCVERIETATARRDAEVARRDEAIQKLSLSTGTNLSAYELSLVQAGNFSELKTVLEAYEEDRTGLQAKLKQAEESSQGLEERWNRMQNKIEESDKRKILIEELRDARSMIRKDGAPARFVQEKFSVMIPLINEKLNVIGASFVIREKIGQPCDFEFMEKFSGGNMWMPQGKLSGGQAVRVTVAFLLTTQQVLTPSFGFIQLDEPSNHQDQDGIEGLREFLIDLPTLIGGHIQCVLVDHKEELQSVVKSKLLLETPAVDPFDQWAEAV